MTAARPAIGSPCRSSGWRAVTLSQNAPRHCDATQVTGGPLAGADINAAVGTEGPIAHPTREPNAHAAPYPLGLLSYPVCDGKQRATDQLPLERTQGKAVRAIFNGRNAQVDAQQDGMPHAAVVAIGGTCRNVDTTHPMQARNQCHAVKREIDARPSTFSFAAEAGKADPRSKPGMNRSSHLAKSVSAKSGSRSCARPAATTFPGNGARGPGVAAFESTAAAPVFNFSSNVEAV